MRASKWVAVVASVFVLGAPVLEAEAKRLGGGLNIGRTAPSPARTAPTAVPPKPAAQPQTAPQGQNAQAAKANPAAPAAAQAGRSSWMGPLAGLAAGLGLAALASYLGFGEELMSLMLVVLAVVAGVVLIRMIMGRRQAPAGSFSQPAMARSGYGNQELGAEARPGNSGWTQHGGSSAGGFIAATEASAPVVEDVSPAEIENFLSAARQQFTQLQAIWDSGDINTLADFCTPEMTRELSHQIAGRRGSLSQTQVVSLDASWLGMAQGVDDFGKPVDEVRIHFSGLIRESADGDATNFDEIWTLHRPLEANGKSGWLLAGIAQAA